MPVIPATALASSLLLTFWLAFPPAAEAAPRSIWVTQKPLVMAGDYRSLSCPYPPPPPYTGPLQVDSKYDQTDPTRSTLGGSASRQSKEISTAVDRYGKMLVRFADYYQSAERSGQAGQALACLDQWLSSWAEAGALLSRDASKTGMAVRKWALASIASTALKAQALSGGQWRADARQQRWLDELADQVLADYRERLSPDFAYFNNHDYWAAWAVVASGLLTGHEKRLDWGALVFQRAMQQLRPGKGGDYAFLPTELARGKLAANYTHYALVSLVLLAEALDSNGRPLSAADRQNMSHLARFAARAVLSPRSLPELAGTPQSAVEPYKMAWLVPFLARDPQHADAAALYRSQKGKVDGYSQIGGRILPLYPDFPVAIGARR